MATPHILFVTRKWAPAVGGMETYSLRVSEALSKLAPVEVVALSGGAGGMPPRGLALLRLPFMLLRRVLGMRRAPLIVHLSDMAIWPLGLLTLHWRRAQIILSAHGTDVTYPRRGGVRGTLYRLYLLLGAALLPGARVIANSCATAAAAAEFGWRAAAVVPLGTDVPSNAKVDGTHDRTIVFAGRLLQLKGCAWFIREVLPLVRTDIRLLVAGTTWDASEAAALAAPRVEYLGCLDQPKLVALYRRAMCVVMPNIPVRSGAFEGFGLVAPEAAAAGGVVLAARCGGLPDAVIDGTTGFLVASGDAQAWAAAIDRIAAWDPAKRRAFVAASQEAVRRHYDWDRVAADTLATYGLAAGAEVAPAETRVALAGRSRGIPRAPAIDAAAQRN